jgi:hypothetical protein
MIMLLLLVLRPAAALVTFVRGLSEPVSPRLQLPKGKDLKAKEAAMVTTLLKVVAAIAVMALVCSVAADRASAMVGPQAATTVIVSPQFGQPINVVRFSPRPWGGAVIVPPPYYGPYYAPYFSPYGYPYYSPYRPQVYFAPRFGGHLWVSPRHFGFGARW